MSNNDQQQQAGMILDQKTVGVWSVQISDTCDWMASLRELVPDEKYQLDYRFRYYKDDKAFDSEDRKSWYKGVISGTRNYVLKSFQECAKVIAGPAKGPLYEVINDGGDYRAFCERFMNLPPVHSRIL